MSLNRPTAPTARVLRLPNCKYVIPCSSAYVQVGSSTWEALYSSVAHSGEDEPSHPAALLQEAFRPTPTATIWHSGAGVAHQPSVSGCWLRRPAQVLKTFPQPCVSLNCCRYSTRPAERPTVQSGQIRIAQVSGNLVNFVQQHSQKVRPVRCSGDCPLSWIDVSQNQS